VQVQSITPEPGPDTQPAPEGATRDIDTATYRLDHEHGKKAQQAEE
jgi:hypothetical protein